MTAPVTHGPGAVPDAQRSQMLRRVVWTTMAAATLALLLQIIEDPSTFVRRGLSIALTTCFGLVALWLNRRGHTSLAGGTFIAALIFIVTWRAWTIGGLDAPVTAGYVVMVVMAGVLLGKRGGAFMAILTAALTLVLILANVEGWLPRSQVSFTPLGLWLSNCIWLALAFALQGEIGASFREALRLTQHELEQRRTVEHMLRERVKEVHLLHEAATLLQRNHVTALESFQELVALIPAGWQHTEVCAARITFGQDVAATDNWRSTEWRIEQSFATEEGTGTIEVVYLEPRPAADDGPFLSEECAVLESLADMLTAYVGLRRQRLALEQLVATRTRELSVARDLADRASRAKTTFLANMSHEIRTPLNAVLGHAQLLDQDPSLAAAHRRSVTAVLTSGAHLLTLINDVLEASKLEAGRTELARQPMDLHGALAGVEHMFTALAQARAIELRFERDDAVPRVIRADAPKIRQVLINLLGNALKFTDRGTVRVRASAELLPDQTVRVTIDVIDTGPGIADEDRQRIFAAFEQSAPGKHVGGTGLGLTISRSFARMMGGDVTLESTSHDGSTFSFTFIADPLPLTALPPDLARAELPLPSPTIRPAPASSRALAALLSELPARRLAELREAAIQARTTRLEQLTEQIAKTAPDTARMLSSLVEDFRYDELVSAIDGMAFEAER